MRAVCVYCGSSTGHDPIHAAAAAALGRTLAQQQRTLVYGGGSVGLMQVCADAALAAGGRVIGVIPELLQRREVAHHGLTELHVVQTMHQRKQMMADLSDAFIALPGGIGTLEELFEVWTWRQLGYHDKPLGLLNVGGYFDALLSFLGHSLQGGFVRGSVLELLRVSQDPQALLLQLHPDADPAADPWWRMRDAV